VPLRRRCDRLPVECDLRFDTENAVFAAVADADEALITLVGGVMVYSSLVQQIRLAAGAPAEAAAAAASGSFLSRLRARIRQTPSTSLTYPPGLGNLTSFAEGYENTHYQLAGRSIPGGQGRSGPAADFPAPFASSETASLPDDQPKTIREIRALSQAAPLPCWPNQPRYVVFLTRDVDRFLERLSLWSLAIWPLLFVFQTQVDTLWTAVFGKESVSHFAFIREQYEYLVTSQTIERFDPTRYPVLAHFRILEIVTWLTMAMCAATLITGIAFLRQFDARYLILSRHPASNWYFVLIIWLALCLYLLTDMRLQIHVSYAVPMMAYAPKVYWTLVAMGYCGASLGIARGIHFLAWKVFRQKWPWARLWHPDNATQSREIS
jgi:hypothetical protein